MNHFYNVLCSELAEYERHFRATRSPVVAAVLGDLTELRSVLALASGAYLLHGGLWDFVKAKIEVIHLGHASVKLPSSARAADS